MKLRFRPATAHADDVLDTHHVRALWRPLESPYMQALQKVSGLTFRHQAAIAHCGQLPVSMSGKIDQEAIWIATRYPAEVGHSRPLRRHDDALLAAITHELCHRLLSEHGLLLVSSTDQAVYKDHQQLYVFLYDSWVAAFGKRRANALAQHEAGIKTPAYHRAWSWAMRLSRRQRAKLTAKLSREYRHKFARAYLTDKELEHLQPVASPEVGGGPPPPPQTEMDPVLAASQMEQNELAQVQEVVDPAQAEVAQPENQPEIIQNFDAMLQNGEDGEKMSRLFAGNLAKAQRSSENPHGGFAKLSLRPGFNLHDRVRPDMSREEYNQVLRESDGTTDVTDDPNHPNLMFSGLLEATGAKVLRDDLADGNEKGSRIYKGMLDGKPVYFEEHVGPITVTENGESKEKFARSVIVLSEDSARSAMDDLSDNEEKALAEMGIERPIPGTPGYERQTRTSMREALDQYAATHAEATPKPEEQPAEKPAEQEYRERLHGLKESTEFDRAMQEKLAEKASAEKTAERKQILDAHGIKAELIDPAAAPTAKRMANLNEEDWADIQEAKDPVVALWSRSNRRTIEATQARLKELAKTESHSELRASLGPQDPKEQVAEEALRRSLPLIHGTSFEAFMAATEDGKFSSNREVYEKGVDVTAGAGNTIEADRQVGLDNYVYADYARPDKMRRRDQAEVTVVLEPTAMQQEGAFVTDHDHMAFEVTNKDGKPNYRTYMGTAYTGEDFAHVALPRIHNMISEHKDAGGWDRPQSLREFANGADSNPDQTGETHFSTWEVKLPETSTGFIRKVIFKNAEQAAAFQEKYGDQIPYEITVDPRLNEHPDSFGVQERYAQEYEGAMQEDYDERMATIEDTPPEERKESYVILYDTETLPEGVDKGQVRPEWFQMGAEFASAEEALAKAEEGFQGMRRHNYGRGVLQIFNPRIEIARVVSGGNASVIAEHQAHDLSQRRRRPTPEAQPNS